MASLIRHILHRILGHFGPVEVQLSRLSRVYPKEHEWSIDILELSKYFRSLIEIPKNYII